MKNIILYTLLLFLCVRAFPQEVDIDITKQRLKKIGIKIDKFVSKGTADYILSDALYETLLQDIKMTDYFKAEGGGKEISLYLKCSYTPGKNGRLAIEGRLYESKKGQMLMGKRFAGKRKQYRALVHKLTDALIHRITGERGIASSHIVFEGAVNGRKQIFISSYDGADTVQLTNNPCTNLLPAPAPDGVRIAYTSYIYKFPQVFIYDIKKGKQRRLSSHPGLNAGASFSPDGKKIALTLSKDGNPEIYTVNTDGSGLRRITKNGAVDTSPSWSPDGRKIAFVSNRQGTVQIYVIPSGGGMARRITYEGSYNTSPSWSPKGDMIAFSSLKGGVFQVYTISTSTGDIRQITHGNTSCESPSFAPDGRHIVFSMREGYNSALYITDVFFMDLRRLNMRIPGTANPEWGK